MQILNCEQYHNPFTTPYACITVLDSLAFFGAFVFVVFCIIIFSSSQK